jgi:hypothetical protein
MTDTPNPARARAEAVFRTITPEGKQSATDEYRAKQKAELDKMARLKAIRFDLRRREFCP